MELEEAARLVENTSHLLITAGAGMGVDSGLPDFRGNEGFWNAYPPYRRLGFSFVEMASPDTFVADPTLAWGFYGHRLNLYRETEPHEGFDILRGWAEKKKSHFVFTSNVDGQFQTAGFDPDLIYEVHGSIHHLQCLRPCSGEVWPGDHVEVEIDKESMRATGTLPSCPRCGALARPNILMFGDFGYVPTRQEEQGLRYQSFLRDVGSEMLVIVEMGAGIAVPTVRYQDERLAGARNARLIRINPRDPDVPEGEISISQGAREALQKLDALVTI
jgi:NAD-dependent SIR2 family protein deacetylase